MLLPAPHRPLPSLLRHLAAPPPARRSGRSRPPLHGQARGPSGRPPSSHHLRRAKAAAEVRRDRKSTRLNSSHGYISYAVFCLKKKKKVNKQTLAQSDTETH